MRQRLATAEMEVESRGLVLDPSEGRRGGRKFYENRYDPKQIRVRVVDCEFHENGASLNIDPTVWMQVSDDSVSILSVIAKVSNITATAVQSERAPVRKAA